ncbi:MAG TPA: hypothetical protein VGU74_00955, partial [Gemmatimonadales bacterium]|nr:hypothetical protein [Gemmatimonadales bacterium]
MRPLPLAFVLALAAATPLAAQEASPYLPIGHWSMPYVEHLIAAGRMADPSPLSRPFKVDDVLRALAAVDSSVVSGSEWAVVRKIRAELTRTMRGPSARVDLDAGIAGSSHARRDPLREAGVGHATFNGGAALTFYFGPVVVSTHPYFDTRLKWDPDYYGKKDRVIAGRFAEAYGSAQWRYGEIFFGSLDRNWGPRFTEGLLVSPSPYSYDQLDFKIGTEGIYLEGILTQLDDIADSSGTANQRHFVA